MPHAAIQRQLPDKNAVGDIRDDLLRYQEKPDGNRQVVRGTFLTEIRPAQG